MSEANLTNRINEMEYRILDSDEIREKMDTLVQENLQSKKTLE